LTDKGDEAETCFLCVTCLQLVNEENSIANVDPKKLSKKLLKLAEKDAENAGEDPSPHFPNASPALFIL